MVNLETNKIKQISQSEREKKEKNKKQIIAISCRDKRLLLFLIPPLSKDGDSPILQDVMSAMSKVNEHAHKFAFTIVFYHLARQLAQISTMEVS